jgi:hypothetical protein
MRRQIIAVAALALASIAALPETRPTTEPADPFGTRERFHWLMKESHGRLLNVIHEKGIDIETWISDVDGGSMEWIITIGADGKIRKIVSPGKPWRPRNGPLELPADLGQKA